MYLNVFQYILMYLNIYINEFKFILIYRVAQETLPILISGRSDLANYDPNRPFCNAFFDQRSSLELI